MLGHTDAGTCPECGTTGAQPGQLVCRGCFVPFALMAPVRDAVPGRAGRGGRAAGSGAGAPGEEEDPDATDVLPQMPAPAHPPRDAEHTRIIHVIPGAMPGVAQTRRDAPARALRLSFPSGEIVSVELGESIKLGREPQFCPAVTFLAVHDNLSRIHATVGVEFDGSAWIVDEGSTNGTFVHGYRLVSGERARLRPGDKIRLAADVNIRVLP